MFSVKKLWTLLCILCLALFACEDTNMRLATEAGVDAVKALTLSDQQVQRLAAKTAEHVDQKHRIAPRQSPYARRLKRLVAPHQEMQGLEFEYQVYLHSQVNAFALADGSIRIYQGLMDLLDDEELLFVIGHEIGHVLGEHVQEKMQLALAGSALRKGVASQQGLVGDLARSSLGGFVQHLLNAQFSQQEEREADDFGLQFMHDHGYPPAKAVSALRKLAGLGSTHSFLSTHPDPDNRAERLRERLQNPDQKQESPGIVERVWSWLHQGLKWGMDLLRWLTDLVWAEKVSVQGSLSRPGDAGLMFRVLFDSRTL